MLRSGPHLKNCVDIITLLDLCIGSAQPRGLCILLRSYAVLYGALNLTCCLVQPIHLRKVLQPPRTASHHMPFCQFQHQPKSSVKYCRQLMVIMSSTSESSV